MQRTRQQILHYLKAYKTASAQELSGAISVTAANIRHHLGLLLESGLIQEVGKRAVKGPGRPQLLYGLTSQALEDNLTGLLGAILSVLEDSPPVGGKDRDLYQAFARALINGREANGHTVVERFNQAIAILNDLHYRASWEAHPVGPQVILKHCPYRDLSHHHPQLCQLDQHLLTILTERKMTLSVKRSFSSAAPAQCTFTAAGVDG